MNRCSFKIRALLKADFNQLTGKHTYLHIVIHLDDICERGKAWKIWENMQFIDASKPDDFYDGDLSWINFQGRWGNIQQIVGDPSLMYGIIVGCKSLEGCLQK